jgi:hypothetical protein
MRVAAMTFGLVMVSMLWPRGAAAAERRAASAVTLRIHDYVGVPGESLTRAQSLVSQFYQRVGVRTRWAGTVARRRGGLVSGPIEDVTVIVLNRRMAEGSTINPGTLGFAAISRRPPGRVAYVVYDRVDLTAADSDWTLADLLSVVMTHEIAHLYLPPGSHSPGGLMRGAWTIDELRRTDPSRLRFTEHQAELLRAGVGEPPATTGGPDLQVVGELQMASDRSGPAEAGHHVLNQPLKRR